MLKIDRTIDDRSVLFTLSGRLAAENIAALSAAIAEEPPGQLVALDLTDVTLANREAIRFLLHCEGGNHIQLRNCPAFIRAWMAREAKGPIAPE